MMFDFILPVVELAEITSRPSNPTKFKVLLPFQVSKNSFPATFVLALCRVRSERSIIHGANAPRNCENIPRVVYTCDTNKLFEMIIKIVVRIKGVNNSHAKSTTRDFKHIFVWNIHIIGIHLLITGMTARPRLLLATDSIY